MVLDVNDRDGDVVHLDEGLDLAVELGWVLGGVEDDGLSGEEVSSLGLHVDV